MTQFNWRNTQLQQTDYRVRVGEHELRLRRCHNKGEGLVILMMPGFAEDSSRFWPADDQTGLAPFLASLGFDVFVGEWRGKGSSWPQVSRHSDWGVQQLMTEDIPAQLSCIAQLRPGVSQFWIGEGLGSQLLVGAYARSQTLYAEVQGMVHFSAGRRCELPTMYKALAYSFWKMATGLTEKIVGAVGWSSAQSESCGVWRDMCHWHHSEQWKDPSDQFNYRVAAHYHRLPASLYVNSSSSLLWGDGNDTRLWIEELGQHDAQMVRVGRSSGNIRNYSRGELLSHKAAIEDHFSDVVHWLETKKSFIEKKPVGGETNL